LSRHDIGLTQALQDDPVYADLLEKISQSPALHEKLMDRTSSLQVIFCSYMVLSDIIGQLCVLLFLSFILNHF